MRKVFLRKIATTYVIAGLLLLSSVAVLVLISRGLQQSRERIIQTASQAAALEEERKLARLAEDIFDGYNSEISRIERFLVKKDAPVDFIEELEGLARSTGTSLLISSAGGSTLGGFLPLRLEIKGGGDGVLRFLKLLELMPHDIRVEEINWNKNAPQSLLTLNIIVTAL